MIRLVQGTGYAYLHKTNELEIKIYDFVAVANITCHRTEYDFKI